MAYFPPNSAIKEVGHYIGKNQSAPSMAVQQNLSAALLSVDRGRLNSCVAVLAPMTRKISFTVNGTQYDVPSELRADTPLVKFLRNHIGLKGTKYMCKEGGCGACIVTLSRAHPVTGEVVSTAINSCLTPVLACHGGAITTVEGIGNRASGYSKIQAALAKCSGTQCGFCSPGMVMNMHSLLASNPKVTMKDVEKSFGGNVCRCTGYRPILDAFKALSSDASSALKEKIADIEDLWKICPNGQGKTDKKICCSQLILPTENKFSNPAWYIPNTFEELIKILEKVGKTDYVLVAGNTARGVYKGSERASVHININYIPVLKEYRLSSKGLELGANMTLSEVMELFYKVSKDVAHFKYLKIFADHIQLVANVPVKNVGTLAGNLMIKRNHTEFPSDIFLIFETVNAQVITVVNGKERPPAPMTSILKKTKDKELITKVILPSLSSEHKLRTFKVMPRAQNVFAYVNAGFSFKVDTEYKVLEKPSIVYGGISSKFVHAEKTEDYFTGKLLLDKEVFRKGINILSEEIKPTLEGFQASEKFRKKLALNLFYKYVLGLESEMVGAVYRSGGPDLDRAISSGSQLFESKKENWPLNQPLNKIESIIQCAGEAEYANDIPESKWQLYGTLVLAEQANAFITSIDPSPALEIEGVVAFFSAKDIPGKNLFMEARDFINPDNEELFCSGRVLYGGQPIGIIIAESEELAEEAAGKVVITYKSGDPPALCVKDLLRQGKSSRILVQSTKQLEPPGTPGKSKYEIKGEIELGAQYHFTMEPHTCVCIPMEDGLHVYPATQWMSNVQASISRVLDLPENSINMQVRRLGGGFGCKITRATLVATACALAAYKLNRPVKVVLDIETTMKAIGKRNSTYSKYEAGFDETGLIEWLKIWLYDEVGCSLNDPGIVISELAIRNCYENSKWEINLYSALTDAPSSCWMRAPGTLEGFVVIEELMEHISYTLKVDSLKVRTRNFGNNFPLLNEIVTKVIETSNYYERKNDIQLFNETNRWRKRGISLLPLSYHVCYFYTLNAMVSIYAEDGTVAITHGGVEMGQGLNTKAVQMCAATLGIDTKKIKVKPSSVLTSPNNAFSGASVTSDCVVYSTQKCCEILNQRLKEIKNKMIGASWEEIILAAHIKGINLNASYLDHFKDSELKNHYAHAAAVSEVELDVLTGQYQILRSDILEDAGESLNPEIDIGQIEGAFVMGLGYFLSEKITHDPSTGLTITNNTAKYWVPGPRDIPIDFRVSLMDNVPHPTGVGRSKTAGEPPICLSLSALFALKNAIISARQETGLDEWLPLCQPFSVENSCLAANTQVEHLVF